VTTYDQVLDELTVDQLRALCHHQGEQITRLLRQRVECAEHEARIAELEGIIRKHNLRVVKRAKRKGAA